ncbi:MAG: hypothetical protein HYX96_08615 [Chloroflexi bacterium]|nr:hypothetical protein [Chloroflexota bacterium]
MNSYKIKATDQEAMLVDWVLTMHSYSEEYLDYLMKPDIQELRFQAGRIIIRGEGELELTEEEIRWLLAILPITFRFGKEDVGYSLKKKLYGAYLGDELAELKEEVNYGNYSET